MTTPPGPPGPPIINAFPTYRHIRIVPPHQTPSDCVPLPAELWCSGDPQPLDTSSAGWCIWFGTSWSPDYLATLSSLEFAPGVQLWYAVTPLGAAPNFLRFNETGWEQYDAIRLKLRAFFGSYELPRALPVLQGDASLIQINPDKWLGGDGILANMQAWTSAKVGVRYNPEMSADDAREWQCYLAAKREWVLNSSLTDTRRGERLAWLDKVELAFRAYLGHLL
jgi:hypothetical protein